MEATIDNGEPTNDEVRELARRSGDGIDVTLLWNSGTDRVFVLVDDQRRAERFRIPVRNGNALDAFHHPYAYNRHGELEQDPVGLSEAA